MWVWVGGWRHVPTALPTGKRPDTHRIEGWVDTRAGLNGCGKTRPPIRDGSRKGLDRRELIYRLGYPGSRCILKTIYCRNFIFEGKTTYCCLGFIKIDIDRKPSDHHKGWFHINMKRSQVSCYTFLDTFAKLLQATISPPVRMVLGSH